MRKSFQALDLLLIHSASTWRGRYMSSAKGFGLKTDQLPPDIHNFDFELDAHVLLFIRHQPIDDRHAGYLLWLGLPVGSDWRILL